MNEVFLIDKPSGRTSYDIIAELKKLLKEKKIGHAGTLDKFASGLLILCTGRSTKLTRYFLESDKRYFGTIQLGTITDTCDPEGEITEQNEIGGLKEEDILKIKERFTGYISQVPPLYSALKIEGKRASDLARKGESPELKKRGVFIRKLDIISIDLLQGLITIDVECSKGTYIRALARDIGEFLGTGGYLKELRRTASGVFSIEEAVTIDEFRRYLKGEKIDKNFRYFPEDAVSYLRSIVIKNSARKGILNGAPFKEDDIIKMEDSDNKPRRILDEDKNLIAIADIDINNWTIKYLNVFNYYD